MLVGGALLLTDPLLRDRVGHLRRHGLSPPPDGSEAIDAVLVSHLHLDHPRRRVAEAAAARCDGPGPERRRGAAPTPRVRAHRGARDLRAGGGRRGVGAGGPGAHDGRRYPFAPAAAAIGFGIAQIVAQ
jgi:hypothetical protein